MEYYGETQESYILQTLSILRALEDSSWQIVPETIGHLYQYITNGGRAYLQSV